MILAFFVICFKDNRSVLIPARGHLAGKSAITQPPAGDAGFHGAPFSCLAANMHLYRRIPRTRPRPYTWSSGEGLLTCRTAVEGPKPIEAPSFLTGGSTQTIPECVPPAPAVLLGRDGVFLGGTAASDRVEFYSQTRSGFRMVTDT